LRQAQRQDAKEMSHGKKFLLPLPRVSRGTVENPMESSGISEGVRAILEGERWIKVTSPAMAGATDSLIDRHGMLW
jgi:hypothetical protein